MSSVLYLGDVPKGTQSTPASLSERGINLIPVPPSKLIASITVEDHQPNHDLFLANLPTFVHSAQTESPAIIAHRWRPLSVHATPPYAKQPMICWNYPSRVSADFINGLRGSIPGIQETVLKSRSALMAPVPAIKIRDLLTEGAIQTTPGNLTAINIAGFRSYLTAHRIIDAILRTNQYPYKINSNEVPVAEFDSRVYLNEDSFSAKKEKSVTGKEYEQILVRSSQYRAHCNLAVKYTDFNTTVVTKADIPTDHSGLLIPFERELAAPDYAMIPTFFAKYCLGFFGGDGAEAVASFEQFKAGIGGIVSTVWGEQLSHLCWCLDVALRAQATVRVWMDEHSNYMGCLILGGSFNIHLRDRLYQPQAYSVISTDISQSTPHQRAITAIVNSLFTDPMEQGNAMVSLTSTHDLRKMIYTVGLTEGRILQIRSQLRLLSFPGQVPFLTPTSDNLKKVLIQLSSSDFSLDTTFPLHPSQLLNDDRDARLWSCFGPLAPSFLVPGGKTMSLASTFEIREKNTKGEKEVRHITKIGIIMKTLDQAISDLSSMKTSRTIQNPHGSAVVARVSSDSIIRSFEKDAASEVIGALRSYAGVSVVNEAGTSTKRKRDMDDGSGNSSKRPHLTEF